MKVRTFSLGDGVDKVVFATATDAATFKTANGLDTITNFTAGSDKDVLDFATALNSNAYNKTYEVKAAQGEAVALGANDIIVVSNTTGYIKGANTTGSNVVIINSADGKVYFATKTEVTSAAGVAISGLMDSDHQILELTGVDATAFDDSNFGL